MGDQERKPKAERLARLRRRVESAVEQGELTPHNRLVVVVKALIDLLEDEL